MSSCHNHPVFGNPSAIRSACSPPSPRIVADLQQSCPDDCTCYLIESDGSLLVVFRVPFSGRFQLEDGQKGRFYETHYFTVWDVNVETGEVKEVSNLGNRALFLGYNSSFSLEASLARGCLPNCIYYCDNLVIYYTGNTLRPGGSDMGVYDLDLRHKIDDYYDGQSRYCSISPPLWLEPYEFTPFLLD